MDRFDVTTLDEWQDERGTINVARTEWADEDGAGSLVWVRTATGDVEVDPAEVPRLVAALQVAAQERPLDRPLSA